ncbi:chemotaxis protein CheB [Kaistella palustris]|uniref:chemotaxis protein CheB n=1 Tax=Kaistella palustris TaxID=493376 RepID=UPI00041B6F4E|nr:chemotaxis protein CheB [Kaistella palustris]
MEKCEVLIIGGSAGSLDVLLKVLPNLASVLNFPVIIVLHRKTGKENLLTDLLNAKTQLTVKEIEEKERLRAGMIYIAPPSYHLLIEKSKTFSLDASEKINFSRPSIDVTFESAAEVYGNRLVCLLLSGANSDGTNGLKKVKENGGLTAVQAPDTAISRFMPDSALENLEVDRILKPSEMANFINDLSK